LAKEHRTIECLGQSLQGVVTKEVKKATAHLKGSPLDEDCDVNVAGPAGTNDHAVKRLLENKINRSEVDDILRDRASKADAEMALRQI